MQALFLDLFENSLRRIKLVITVLVLVLETRVGQMFFLKAWH